MKTRFIFFVLFCFLGAPILFALSEFELNSSRYKSVKKYWSGARVRSFTGQKGVKIKTYAFVKSADAPALVIVPGRTEAALNYAELIYDLRKTPYSIYTLDHRGQGFSGRMSPDSEMGHVDDFDNYVYDLKYFIEAQVNPGRTKDVFIVAHSMGANIATLLLNAHPRLARALVMTSPMFKINTGKIPLFAGKLLSYFASVVGNASGYALGKMGWTRQETEFEGNLFTNSIKRFQLVINEYLEEPAIRIGGPSYGWALEAFRSCRKIKSIKEFHVPTLVFSGDSDSIVRIGGVAPFCDKVASNCKRYVTPGAKHSLFLETDSVRDPIINNMLLFFGEHRSN